MLIDAPGADPSVGKAPRRHPVARVFGAVIGWGCSLLAAVGIAAHFLDTSHQTLVVLAAGAWVLAPLSVVALVLHLWRRGWFGVVVTVLLVTGQVVVYAPLSVGGTAPASPAASVRVMTQNLLYGRADPVQIVARIRSSDVEVFVAQELTRKAVNGFGQAGLDDLLPYRVVDARPESPGTGLWSRYPITDGRKLASRGLAGVAGTVTLPGGVGVTAVTLHPSAPFPQDPGDWYRDLDRIRGFLLSLPDGPVFAGGDFNATLDHARFRRLLVDGWRDGAEQAGAGLLRTWPADRGVPALVGIDHVLTRGTVATAVERVSAPGSDHVGLLATVVVPR